MTLTTILQGKRKRNHYSYQLVLLTQSEDSYLNQSEPALPVLLKNWMWCGSVEC